MTAGNAFLKTTLRAIGLTRALGWFSLGLGMVEIVAPERLTRWLGMDGLEALVRAYGVREIAGGIPCLASDTAAGPVARLAGDALDIATLVARIGPDNPRRGNAAIALGLVLGITVLDIAAARAKLRVPDAPPAA